MKRLSRKQIALINGHGPNTNIALLTVTNSNIAALSYKWIRKRYDSRMLAVTASTTISAISILPILCGIWFKDVAWGHRCSY